MGDDVVSESPGRSAVLAAQASLFSPSSWQRSAQELRGYTHSTPSKSSSKKHNKKQGSRKKGSKHEKPSSNQRSSLAYSVPFYYNYDQATPSNPAAALANPTPVPHRGREVAPTEITSVSSSLESNGSMNSEEYTTILDYLANMEGSMDESSLGIMATALPLVAGMDMEDTEHWAASTPKPTNRSKRSTPQAIRESATKSERHGAPMRTPSPHSRHGSAFSTPMSWGKKDKKGRVRPSPLSSQAMKDRYCGMTFVVAVDPLSKLVDDDALIVVPHNQAMAVAFAPADADHHAVEIVLPVSMDVDAPTDLPHEIAVIVEPHNEEDEDGSEELSSEREESHSDELGEQYEDILEASPDESGSGEMEDSLSDSEELEDIEGMEDSEEDGDEDDTDSDGSESDISSEDAGSEDEDLPLEPTFSPGRLQSVIDPLILQEEELKRGTGPGALPRKHDTRRTAQRKPRRTEDEGTFVSPKKLSKTEKRKQKKKDRDETPLEYHELQTWNGLIRDWIQHAAFGAPMPFSPMGKYQRKQLHWLSEFYGLRSQSFGSGTRRTTSVFVTKRTHLPDFSLSIAAIKAIHAGIHPFALTTDELQQNATEIEVPKRSKASRKPAGGRRTKKEALKSRSPLTNVAPSTRKDGKSQKSTKKQRDKSSRQRRAREEVWEEQEEHHGLEFSVTSTAKRLVGAGASHIPESNVGHTLLRKLGWTVGGLGREQQGIAHPIEAVIKAGRGGLGS